MRPESHRLNLPLRRCATCVHAAWLAWKRDWLCLHGDNSTRSQYGISGQEFVEIDGAELNGMDGEEYSRYWGGRVVDPEVEVCDEWTGGESS